MENSSNNYSELFFLGHSCFLLRTLEGKQILIDPFLNNNPTYPKSFSKLPLSKIDFIVLTHGHGDHSSDVIETAESNNAPVIATFELASLIHKFSDSKVSILPMNKGGTISIPETNLKLTLTHALHSNSFDAPDGNTYYAGEACGVIITLENGVNIYHAGDTCFFSEMSQIREQYRPEIALLPIGDCYTMGPEEAAKCAKTLGVKTAIPIHWGTFPPLSGTPEQFKKCCEDSNVQVKVLKPGESFKV